jgi:hypothetical protein
MRRTPLLLSCFGIAIIAAACGENETPPPAKGNYVGAPPAALPCVPNLDGKIDFNELQPAIGVTANFLISPALKTRTVDQIGVVGPDGTRVWNFTADLPDDQLFQNRASPLSGKWYESRFPGLENPFVLPVDAGGNNEGVYTHDRTALTLHGLASKVEATNTILPYDRPVQLYRFPLAVGSNYLATADVKNGSFQGLPYAGRDTYEVNVEAAGEVILSDLSVKQALKVQTKVTVAPAAGITTVTRQTNFLFECIGEVVRLVSVAGESDPNFTNAAEVRRLGLSQ